MRDHQILWRQVCEHLLSSMDEQRYETWIKPLSVVEHNDPGHLVLAAHNQFICDFLDQHYKKNILAAIQTRSNQVASVSFVPEERSADSTISSVPEAAPVFRNPHAAHQPPGYEPPRQLPLNAKYTFDSFVVGAGNEFAKSAARAVAEAPGKTKFNPLLFYGGVGLGKTHLIQAIGNFVSIQDPNARITYITSEEFYLAFIDAIKNNRPKEFSEFFRSSDVLLVDDIQFFSGKESTQEEFFFLFNALYQNGKQIALTSDLPPVSLRGLQDRLVSRFQWGLCIDIQPPNLETRVAILKKKAEGGNLNIPQDVLYYIAEKVSSNIRELEGAIVRLLAYASMTNHDISMEVIKTLLKDSVSREKSHVSIDRIIDSVCSFYHIPVNDIRDKNRRKEVSHARQVAMYIAKTKTNHSLKSIGLNFGGRDHSTVIHAITQVDELIKSDIIMAKEIKEIINTIETEK
jgi:chromosomal replication initiator protein